MVNKTVNVFLGLGSNQGNKRKNIDLSRIYIKNIPNTKILNISSTYKSVFYGYIKQPTFFNQVVEISTRLSPELLLMKCLAIENKMGRSRSKQGGSRNIDIDIIFFGDKKISKPKLIIPHHDWKNRIFFINPLIELNCCHIKNKSIELKKDKIHKII